MAEQATRLLLIDDDEDAPVLVRHQLREATDSHFELDWADSYDTGLKRLCEEPYALCLLDYRLDGRDGLELLREARRRGCRIPIIMLTGYGNHAVDVEAMKAGASDYLLKDTRDAAGLERAIRYVLERQHLLDELEEQSGQLRRLAAELARTEQRERRRLAQILHDHLQQILVAARMRTGALSGSADNTVQENAGQLDELLEEAISASRNLSQELCPPVLYDHGLVEALRWLGRSFGDRHALEVAVEAHGEAEPADQDLQAFLFQAVRELLLNAVKHGRANRAWIRMDRPNNGLRIRVEDDGEGAEPDQLFQNAGDSGFGLFSIRQRLNVLGGSAQVAAAPHEGCRVTLQLAPEGAADEDGSWDDEHAAAHQHESDG